MIHKRLQRSLAGTALAGAALALAACGGGSSGSGSLTLGITDMPLDVENVTRVQVTFDRIDLKPADEPVITIDLSDNPRVIANLLDLQGNASEAIFEGETVPSGQYNWIRLFVVGGQDDSFVVDNGSEFDLFIPGQQPPASEPGRFLQLSSPFFVPAGGTGEITVDVELRKALVKITDTFTGTPHYLLRPSLRLIDNSNAAHLVGEITNNFVQTNCPDVDDPADGNGDADNGLAVYVFDDSTPIVDASGDGGDFGDPNNAPVSTDLAELNSEGNYDYRIGFLEAGEYTAAVTCEAKSDTFDPEVDDDEDLEFVAQENVEIIAGNEPTVENFGSPDP